MEAQDNATHITGNITLQSPYKGYQRGLLLGRLHYTSDLDVDGFADLNLERKEYFGTIKGENHTGQSRYGSLLVNRYIHVVCGFC